MQISKKVADQVSSNRRLVLLLSATIALTAACGTSAKSSSAPVTSAAPASSTAASSTSPASPSVSVPQSPSASSSRPTAASSSAPTKPPSTSATPSQSSPATTAEGCQASALKVEALRGSGAAGHQYAFLQFTNTSATACSLTGFPGVQLRVAGAALGKPATRSDKVVATVKLAPGTSAIARLVDASTCQAAKSDSVQVFPPNLPEKFLVPLSIRGCALTIDPVVAS
jgi:Protein of unknown function (DUF4232)